MIHTITYYLYQINHERDMLELQMAKRRAFRLTVALFITITIGVLAWILR